MMPARVALALQADGSDTKESQAISKVISRIQDAYDHDDPPPDKVMAVLELLETEYIEARGDSWYLRSEIIWHKPNPMPESVTGRPTSAHEKLFLFAKSPAARPSGRMRTAAVATPSPRRITSGWTRLVCGIQSSMEKKTRIACRLAPNGPGATGGAGGHTFTTPRRCGCLIRKDRPIA